MTKDTFSYRNGVLNAEALPLAEIAEDKDTPFYCLSAKQIQRNYRILSTELSDLSPLIHYEVRQNANLAVIKLLSEKGAGADVVSAGELARALDADVHPEKIMMSGAGRTRDDITAALIANVAGITASSLFEITNIEDEAARLEKNAPVFWHVDTAVDQAVGQADILSFLSSATHCRLKGLRASCTDEASWQKLADKVRLCRDAGFAVGYLNLVTGVMDSQIAWLREYIVPLGCSMTFSAGTQIVQDAGVLVSRVLHVSDDYEPRSVLIDADSHYGADYEIIPVRKDIDGESRATSIAGPLGRLVDSWGDHKLPSAIKAGDLLAVMGCGALGLSSVSPDRGRALVSEILVSGAQYAVIRRRLAVAEQMGWESYPDWMVRSRVS